MNFRLLLLLPLATALACAAETTPQLREQLKRYPDADTNRDGVLTTEEAEAYAKTIRQGKKAPTVSAVNDDGSPSAASTTRKPAPAHADVRYGPHERNVLDLWLAKSNRPTPLIVYIHGGGFVNGSKAGAGADMINASLKAGVSFMAINYRFRTSAPIQDILRDCARSIQFVRSKAREYNLDPTRIASYGGSAGAGTSLWLAFHPDLADPKSADPVLRESSRIIAAGALNTQATYNLLRWPEFLGKPNSAWDRPDETAAFYGFKSAEDLALAKAILDDVDMLELISRDDAPVFLFTAHPDGELMNRSHFLHHPKHARAVKKACDEAGVEATLWFATTEPRISGDYQVKLREFLFKHLTVTSNSER